MIEVSREDFAHPGLQYLIGISPCQIDFLTSLPGVCDFEMAWDNRATPDNEGIPVHFLGKNDLITAKTIAGRLQDLADIEEMRRVE